MKILLSLIITILLFLPNNLNALDNFTLDFNTDIINTEGVYNAKFNTQISAYYDLRNRQSSVQITNFSANNIRIHVQIFQHDRGCDELNFFDDLTPNDTVVYNMDNIIKNDGSNAPVNLADDSYGYVVVSDTRLDDGINENTFPSLIGNFRIADDSGYEYRTNMISPDRSREAFPVDAANLIAHFNTADNAQFADVVGYAFEGVTSNTSTVNNIDEGFSFDIFVYDMNEEPLSCDRRNFACGNVMNYGINEDYPASRGNDLVCPGGGLANPDGGFISFENGSNLDGGDLDGDGIGDDASDQNDFFVGLIGINNGDGTGSMDTWINEFFIGYI
ncbi:MAG: hypothetical protein GTO02_21865 [Candidatus Dadabacteria bacterium]|nr:hypothetical protein [Candidatus Dadabacteria bacterium]NIQ16932.1 hypothetical protein [Candidatus Dadabacteria bacterium]